MELGRSLIENWDLWPEKQTHHGGADGGRRRGRGGRAGLAVVAAVRRRGRAVLVLLLAGRQRVGLLDAVQLRGGASRHVPALHNERALL